MNKLQVLPEETHSLQVLEPMADTAALFEAGKKAQYDAFWDATQDYGNRTEYRYAFMGTGWKDCFVPKYDIKPRNAECMFWNSTIPNIEEAFRNSGIAFDTSNCINGFRLFANTSTEVIPQLDLTSGGYWCEVVANSEVRVIRKIILNDKGDANTGAFFHGANKLEEVRFEGVIPAYAINLQACANLSNESVQSIIDHLKDLTGATTQTLTFHKDVGARLTEAQKATITAKNWTLVY